MLNLNKKLDTAVVHDEVMTLPYDMRQKSRFRTSLDSGEEVGVILARGTVLREGDCLQAEDGRVVLIKAAAETLSTVAVDDPLLFARAAYHLGNRHVPLQITAGRLSYQHDHVLDEMLLQMGLSVDCEQGGFEPESGAYSSGHSHHGHHHGHSHD